MACPDVEKLERFVRGVVSEAERAELREHLATCADCNRRLAEAASNLHGEQELEQPEPGSSDTPRLAEDGSSPELDVTVPDLNRPKSPTRAVQIPARVGSVRLLRLIGRGGMGEVWLGRDELLDREVAVKFLLNAKPTRDDPGFKSLLEGARTAAAVRHANLTVIHHAGFAADRPYLVLEYIDGPTLEQVLRSVGPLELSSTLKIIEAVVEAVGELHARGIVHRDIKPANVLLDREGRVFVTDFGLACQRRVRELETSVAETAGTPHYMAPEMFEQTVSVRSDVYALGIMSYKMLTGTVPFRGTFQEIREQHLNVTLPVDKLRERGHGDALIDVLQRATHKSAMYRYKSAAQFLRSLQDARIADGATSERRVDLAGLVGRAAQSGDSRKKSTTGDSSYYEHLASRATERRSMREPVEPAAAAPLKPAPPRRAVDPVPGTVVETLQVDVPCGTCTYNLRGLAGDGNCPECGESIAASLHARRLMFADRAWLSGVAAGVRRASIGALAVILAVPLVGSVLSVAFRYLPSLRTSAGLLQAFVVLSIVCLTPWVFTFLAILRSTTREPHSAGIRIRIASRVLAGIWLALLLGGLPQLVLFRRYLPDWMFGVGATLCVFILLCGLAAYLRFLSALAERLPDVDTPRRARGLGLVLAALAALIPVSYFTLDLVLPTSAAAGRFVLGLACLLALIVLPIPVWRRLRGFSRGFRSALAVCTPHDALFGGGRSSRSASVVLCVKCGYNLHGLEADSRCPECGTPLSSSAQGDRLSAADPAWLRGIYRGQLILVAGCAALGAAAILPVLYVTFANFRAAQVGAFIDVVVPVLFLGGVAAVLLGILGVTSLDPRLSLTEQPVALRRLTRGIVASALAVLATAKLLPSSSSSLSAVAEVSKSALGWTGVALLGLSAVCFSYYLAHLAERIPDARLADRTRLTAKRFVISLAVCVGVRLIAALAGFDGLSPMLRTQSRLWMLIALAGALSGIFAFFVGIGMMLRWWTFQRALKRSLLDARRTDQE